MGKRSYRAISVKTVDVTRLVESAAGKKLVLGIDAAKEDYKAVFMDEEEEVLVTFGWRHPDESPEVIGLLEALREKGVPIEAAMEPTGTYADSLLHQLVARGFEVYRVSPKRTHDAAEVYDGVPSHHDAKSAAIVAKLHWDKRSDLWVELSAARRELKAISSVHSILSQSLYQTLNRLEALTAKYWPNLTQFLELTGATFLVVLEAYGGPAAVSKAPEKATQLMKRSSRGWLKAETIEAVVRSAATSQGVPMLEWEVWEMKQLAGEALRLRKKAAQVEGVLIEHGVEIPEVSRLSKVAGMVTALTLYAILGSAVGYPAAKAWLRAMGLNLKERSSGKHQGQLKITKRGPGEVRRLLYLTALRLIQSDPVIKAWYAKKVERGGDKGKGRAVVAVMRKLAAGLWHVARGAQWDSAKLFDVRKLNLVECKPRTRNQFNQFVKEAVE